MHFIGEFIILFQKIYLGGKMINIKTNSLIEKIIEREHLDTEILDLTLDPAFKKVFLDERNKWYLSFLISYCTKMYI